MSSLSASSCRSRFLGADWARSLGCNPISFVRHAVGALLAQRVAGILGGFEDARKLVIFQVPNGPLSVELKNLGLNFFVNANGLLECRELGAEVNPDQEAGTLYGFRSGLVLRAVGAGGNQQQRCILTPLGAVSWTREDFHVSVRITSADHYGRFDIDQVLGQLTCAPEPELLYTKALLHALTSFALPDGLTRRTGAEESLRTLESGRGQPW
ncbi:hypothetical protein B0T25DRAFT_627806 [Lasiosphaeria hispida]|uniref:Uncharacterized protein n=1 Tax=Lasiosphaeria hispida TaxID=260671 RepID=A0AAJ0HVL8_9PEZI|nr:hypothetical protein B0T25DRAFT_627806 [Lasiosphaeria hispida]